MEVLEVNDETVERVVPAWDEWLAFDRRPRIIERGIDFIEEVSTVKRWLFTEAARRGLDIVARVLPEDRLLFQVFHPDGAFPKLPDLPDARQKHPWGLWLDGDTHTVLIDSELERASLRAYVYKQAKVRGLKVRVVFVVGGLTIQAYKPAEKENNATDTESSSNSA